MRPRGWIAGMTVAWAAGLAAGQGTVSIDRDAYLNQLHGMWLAECIADWTGLQTEGRRNEAPFYTDADWGTVLPGTSWPLGFVTDQDPWQADDNTDVEYVYLHMMTQQGRIDLSPAEIAAGWLLHMNPDYIWVSNHRAWELMGRGVLPPMTGAAVANGYSLYIDAQLTTEFYGALCPGMPAEALRHADLPIRTVASGFAAQAAQFYVLLHALTPLVDRSAAPRDQVVWLVREAQKWIPATSKTSDIVAFVLADFLANPDPQDWERTRDRVYDRYQLHAGDHGFIYRDWTESSVNFAAGIVALLYGAGDLRRTVQIGTLGGWDSDDQTATMAAVLGLLIGYDGVRAQFPGAPISDRYHITQTRWNMPDYLPGDPGAEDTLLMMSLRMMPLIDQAVTQAGGTATPGRWVVPVALPQKQVLLNPMVIEQQRSANVRVRQLRGSVACSATRNGAPPWPPWVNGAGDPTLIGNGYEADAAGRDGDQSAKYFFSSQGGGGVEGEVQTLSVEYSLPVQTTTVRFIEGDHFTGAGGWFESIGMQVRVDGVWRGVAGAVQSAALDPSRPFQIIDWALPQSLMVTGVRVTGPVAGGFVTCCELDALRAGGGPAIGVLGPR